MVVEPANLSCLTTLEAIKWDCIRHMRAAGIDQWDDIYPTTDLLHRDCIEGNLFVLKDAELQVVGYATLDQRQSAEYVTVDWLHKVERIGVVHRLMISPKHHGRGYAKLLMRGLEGEALQRGYRAIRLDAFLRNPSALRLYVALGYVRVGQVQFRKGPFACFEKRIDSVV